VISSQASQLDLYAAELSAKIRTRGEDAIALINRLRDEKSEALKTAVEAAQAELTGLLESLENPSREGKSRGSIMIDNISRKRLALDHLKLASYSFKQIEAEPGMLKIATASISFPSHQLRLLQSDIEERKALDDARKKEEADEEAMGWMSSGFFADEEGY
jgi:hypothetical protein